MKHVAHEQVDEYRALKPRLYPVILRANKAIYALASSVLESNHYILVSTRYPMLCRAFENNGGRAWKDASRLAWYQKYHLRLHIVPRTAVTPMKVAEFFMICLDSAPLFAQTLQMLYLANQPQFSFKFDIKAPSHAPSLTTKVQQDILDPFMNIRGRHQKCSVRGMLDAALKEKLESKLTQTVYWTRAEHHVLQSICVLKDELARTAMSDGKVLVAVSHYDELDRWQQALGATCTTLLKSQDSTLRWDHQHFTCSRTANHCLAMLHCAFQSRNDNPMVSRTFYQMVAEHPTLVPVGGHEKFTKAIVHTMRGISLFAMDRYQEAQHHCELAVNDAVKYKSSIDALKLVSDFRSKKSKKRTRQQILAELNECLPRTAIGAPVEVHNLDLDIGIYQDEFLKLFTYAYNGDISFAQPLWDHLKKTMTPNVLAHVARVREQGLRSSEIVVGPKPSVAPPGSRPYIYKPQKFGMTALAPDRPPDEATIFMDMISTIGQSRI